LLVILAVKGFELINLQCINISSMCVFAVRMLFAIHITVYQTACYKLWFLQINTEALFAVLFVNVQLYFGKGCTGKHFIDHRQQCIQMFGERV